MRFHLREIYRSKTLPSKLAVVTGIFADGLEAEIQIEIAGPKRVRYADFILQDAWDLIAMGEAGAGPDKQ